MWALIIDDRVYEITDVNPKDRFDPAMVWVKCPKTVEQGWSYIDGKFAAN